MSAEHVFHDYLTRRPVSSIEEREAIDRAVTDVWEANGRPLVIEASDPRYGDGARTFFVFGQDGGFYVTQFPPLATALRCPSHLESSPRPVVADAACAVA